MPAQQPNINPFGYPQSFIETGNPEIYQQQQFVPPENFADLKALLDKLIDPNTRIYSKSKLKQKNRSYP